MPHIRQQVGRGRTPGGHPPSLSAVSSQGWGGFRRPSPSPSPFPSLGSVVSDVWAAGATTGVTVAPSVLTAVGAKGAAGAMAGPIGAAIGAGVAAITILIMKFRQTGQQKVAATNIVNEVEPLLRRNRDAYLASNRTQSEQAQSMENFNSLWSIVVSKCSDPALGSAGERCITERQEGARPPWGPNWFQLYFDPIRNDPNVIQDPGVTTDPATGKLVGGGGDGIFGGFNLGPEMIPGVSNVVLLGGAAVALLLVMGTGGDGK